VTDLQQAQAAYDTAIQKQRAAADAASAASSAVFEAKKQLDIAKQYLAATVPVDRSARQLSAAAPSLTITARSTLRPASKRATSS
jgi:hypothetical protein